MKNYSNFISKTNLTFFYKKEKLNSNFVDNIATGMSYFIHLTIFEL